LDELFQNDFQAIIDEVITFFLAGMATIQVSSANLICYLANNLEFK